MAVINLPIFCFSSHQSIDLSLAGINVELSRVKSCGIAIKKSSSQHSSSNAFIFQCCNMLPLLLMFIALIIYGHL